MRFLSLSLAALFLAAPASIVEAAPLASPATPDAATLASRYIAWRGGKAFEQMRSIHTTADAEADGLMGTSAEWRLRSGYARDEYDLGVTKGLSVRTPRGGWDKDDALAVATGHFANVDAQRGLAMEFGYAVDGSDRSATRQRIADEEMDGRKWAVLRIKFGDADRYDLFLDPATGELHARRYITDGRPHLIRFSDWRMIDGVRFPFLREYFRPNGKLDSTEKVRSIEINRDFAPALFARPESERTLAFAPGSHSTGPIKYNPFTGTRIYIPAKVNGRDVEVLLDSGADSTVLDKGFAENVGRKMIGSGTAVGSGGDQESGIAKDIAIQIGTMTLNLPTVSVVDLAPVGKRIGIPLPVILGRDVFLQAVVDVDPSGPTISFDDPTTFTPPPGATEVPLEPLGSLRSVPVSVEGLPDAPMIFDLGNGGYMTLTPAYWQKHDLLAGRKTSTRSSGAIGGEQINTVATLKTMRFAGVTFHDVPTEFTAPNVEIDSDREAGNVGMPLLKRFRMMIDFQNNRMFVIPIKDRVAEPFDRDRAGLRAVQDGNKLVVKHVSAGSPAAAAGWKDGDTITAIDGHPIGDDFASSQLSLWARRDHGTIVSLTMADGSVRKLKLADYF